MEKEEIVREGVEKIEKQKKLLLENYAETHAALIKAFPLAELLELAKPE